MPKKIKASELLDAKVEVRLPSLLKAEWKCEAEDYGQSLSDWVRGQVRLDNQPENVIKTGKPTPKRHVYAQNRDYTSVDPELLRELAQQGNNLNQIAYHSNKGRDIDLQVLAALLTVESKLDSIIMFYLWDDAEQIDLDVEVDDAH